MDRPKLEGKLLRVSFQGFGPLLSSSFHPRVAPIWNIAAGAGSKNSKRNPLSWQRIGKKWFCESVNVGISFSIFSFNVSQRWTSHKAALWWQRWWQRHLKPQEKTHLSCQLKEEKGPLWLNECIIFLSLQCSEGGPGHMKLCDSSGGYNSKKNSILGARRLV